MSTKELDEMRARRRDKRRAVQALEALVKPKPIVGGKDGCRGRSRYCRLSDALEAFKRKPRSVLPYFCCKCHGHHVERPDDDDTTIAISQS